MNPPPAGEPKRRLMTQWVFGINGWLMVIGVFLDYHSMWKRTPSLTKLCTPLTAGGDWKAKKRPSSARSLDFETRTRIETARSCQQFPSCRLTVSISFIFHRLFHIIHPRKGWKRSTPTHRCRVIWAAHVRLQVQEIALTECCASCRHLPASRFGSQWGEKVCSSTVEMVVWWLWSINSFLCFIIF